MIDTPPAETTRPLVNRSSATQDTPFAARHIGPRDADAQAMLATLGFETTEELIAQAIPAVIRTEDLPMAARNRDGMSETEILADLADLAARNRIFKTYLGMGYSDCITPPVILRNLIEDPRWYTPYTPYQAEISQGRMESLLNFQTMIMDLTGMGIANASLLDEGTAAAEAMTMCHGLKTGTDRIFFVAANCHPQTIAVVQQRAEPQGIKVVIGDPDTFDFQRPLFGALVQYPATDGVIHDYRAFAQKVHDHDALLVAAADLLSLVLITPPGEWGADVVVGSSQRFGVPLGYGGPHAAYFATQDTYRRSIPGRLIGVSKDAQGRPGLRLTLQTREQHIRRDKATSNICTAQALLANVAAMYAVYHGPEGLKQIARRVHARANQLEQALKQLGFELSDAPYFDTLRVTVGADNLAATLQRAEQQVVNLRVLDEATVGIALDETTTEADVRVLLTVLAGAERAGQIETLSGDALLPCEEPGLARTSEFLTHPVFNSHRSETQMMRYLNKLANRDLSLANSMIPLGSCTMKLNAAAEMIPITWPGFNKLHPFAPREQTQGYKELTDRLEGMLSELTGFDAVSLQPNAGAQGEYAGLLVIRRYHQARGDAHRNICLIPNSAHGTNPASAVMAGMKVVVVNTDPQGNVDVADLNAKAEANRDNLAALMITYPSTHGVFETSIRDICAIIHTNGGQVYLDGANMNAMIGLSQPGAWGADVCHLNLHKTFCIPHGGGGPGMGPIGVKSHLAAYLPSHPIVPTGGSDPLGPVSAAPFGSASILPISYAYIALMGAEGLRKATETAILNANYIARRLDEHFPVLYRGTNGMVAHECILDLRPLKVSAGIEVEDVAKRLMDFGFHPPTVSWPVAGTMMIEPTESESKDELDRFCDALIAIRQEIRAIEEGQADRADNVLKHAPHTAEQVIAGDWNRPYSREQAAYPAPWTRDNKYWPPVARIDNVFGDRNVVCSCPPIEAYA